MMWGRGRSDGENEREPNIEGEMKRVILLERWRRAHYPSLQMLCSICM